MSNFSQSSANTAEEERAVLRYATAFFRPSLAESALALKGRHLGNWRVESLLAIGGEGLIYRVSSPERRGVMKMPHLPYDRPADFGTTDILRLRNELEFEARMLSQFSGRLLPALYEAVEAPNPLLVNRLPDVAEHELYLVMEDIAGLPLDAWICHRKEQLRSGSIRQLLVKWLYRLLHFMLELSQFAPGFYYIDFKPANLRVTADDDIALLDAGSIVQSGDHRPIPFTPGYLSENSLRSGSFEKMSLQALISTIYAGITNRMLSPGSVIDLSTIGVNYGEDLTEWCGNTYTPDGYRIEEALATLPPA